MFLFEFIPLGHRVLAVEKIRLDHKRFEIAQAHLRVLGVGLGGEQGQGPFFGEDDFTDVAAGFGHPGLLRGIDRREGAGVGACHHADRAVHRLGQRLLKRGYRVEMMRLGMGKKSLGGVHRGHPDQGKRARLQ